MILVTYLGKLEISLLLGIICTHLIRHDSVLLIRNPFRGQA